MKRKEDWNTRQKKRECKDENPFRSLMKILFHFFKDLVQRLEKIEDPRNTAYTTYTQADLIILGMMKNFCSIETMNSMGENFNDEICIRNLSLITGHSDLEELPHPDTLNYYLERLSPEALSQIRREMVRRLIRSKDFDNAKLNDSHWRIILDGSGLFYFKEKHCENCLREPVKDKDGNITGYRYYHKVLEAKLVLAENIVISLGTEFIENENEDVKKQDCELNAAKRLLARIKEEYPRLKICIQGDALYAAESIMAICKDYEWKYIFTQKDTRQRLIGECYEQLEDCDKAKVEGIGKEKGTGYYYNHVEELVGKSEVMNVYEYKYQAEDKDGNIKTHQMLWVTNINLTERKLEEMVNAGRERWKIENEGFNTQKNVLYKIQHLNSKNPNAMKNHYLLTQISDIIMQLYFAWGNACDAVQEMKRNTALRIMEAYRHISLTVEDLSFIMKRTSIYLQ